MAFQQPVHAPVRPAIPISESPHQATRGSFPQQAHPEQSQEWVLFDRKSDSQTLSTAYTPQTADLSRLSTFGSLERRQEVADDLEEDGDLDSLDEGLNAFHEHMPAQDYGSVYPNAPVLPTHDGLGTFPASSHPVQEHLWHFERFNPRRRALGLHRRRSSIQRRLDALEVDDQSQIESERTNRIERWRAEHSQILLEEVEKVSRRASDNHSKASDIDAALKVGGHSNIEVTANPDTTGTERPRPGNANAEDTETLWRLVIRKLIHDFLGIDDATLCLIAGESLVSEQKTGQADNSGISAQSSLARQSTLYVNRLLIDRFSKELANVLSRISYLPTALNPPVDPKTLDYAGIPILDPGVSQHSAPTAVEDQDPKLGDESSEAGVFRPTLPERPVSAASEHGHAALWGIEEEAMEDNAAATHDHDYWEQAPSLRTIFRLLRQHFTARRRPLLTASTFSSNKPSNVATTSTVDSLRRAAVIRKHHPLVSNQYPRRNTPGSVLGPGYRQYGSHNGRNLSSPWLRRSESSCASISARNHRQGSGSSRHYWDLGGSVGSGSAGGIGGWGEV
ncbi:MAG: hypothetical protein Q9174_001955 [Haloplaca sp. 1 TL-2023]